jgi:hypothetical protein
VQYLLLVFTIFEVLEGPIHGVNELELPNCIKRRHEPPKNIVQHRDICCCNDTSGSIFSAATVGTHWAPVGCPEGEMADTLDAACYVRSIMVVVKNRGTQ